MSHSGYDFKTLSPADFEDLVRDVISADYGVRFEGFGPGPDGGVDGRHAPAGERAIILQAKHRIGSSFSSLNTAMRKERAAVARLKPGRYILATSQMLTPKQKATLKATLKPFVRNTRDTLGQTELNSLLRKYPNVEKGHLKLWLSSTAVLERLLNAAAFSYSQISKEEIAQKLKVYAPNPSFQDALEVLEKQHVIIISEAPGVGKTTLGQMISYSFIAEEWDFIAIKNLDDGFSLIDDSRKQVFFFDDFLGKIALDKKALSSKDADLTKVIRRVQKSKNARFVLTTRAYIYEEARRVSESIADKRLDIANMYWMLVSTRGK